MANIGPGARLVIGKNAIRLPDGGYPKPIPAGQANQEGFRYRFARIPGVTPKALLPVPFYLPVALNELTVEEDLIHSDYDTVSAGEYSVAGPGGLAVRKLRTADLETLTIDWHRYARWLSNPAATPAQVQAKIIALARGKHPFELLIVQGVYFGLGTPEELRMNITIRHLTKVAKPGEADTRYWTLQIKEWRDNGTGRRGIGSAPHLPTTHLLTEKDTLQSLAKHYYGAYGAWRTIANANGVRNWGPTTELVKLAKFKIGDKVKIPKKPPIASTNPVK